MTTADRSSVRITPAELVLVCSHYSLGKIRKVRPLAAGSAASPKVILESDLATYLLKRRSPGAASDPRSVASTHEIILHLERAGLPAPELVGTAADNNSMLQLDDNIYEVYRFVAGRPYARSTDDALAAGALLARAHLELAAFNPSWPMPTSSAHANPAVERYLRDLPRALQRPELSPLCLSLASRYILARDSVTSLGWSSLKSQVIHSDWHPGNMLFSRHATGPTLAGEDPRLRIAAVLDFESARIAPPILDSSLGAMQFALARRPSSPPTTLAASPQAPRLGLDPDLFRAFWRGYLLLAPPLPHHIAQMVPNLMTQALIAETFATLWTTGSFGGLDAEAVLRMVDAATGAFQKAAETLVSIVRIP